MDPKENNQLDALVRSLNEFKEAQYKFNTHCTHELEEISRGLYGDTKNNRPGIIQDLIEIEKSYDERLTVIRARVKVIERQQYKTGVWLAVGSAIIISIAEFFKSIWK